MPWWMMRDQEIANLVQNTYQNLAARPSLSPAGYSRESLLALAAAALSLDSHRASASLSLYAHADTSVIPGYAVGSGCVRWCLALLVDARAAEVPDPAILESEISVRANQWILTAADWCEQLIAQPWLSAVQADLSGLRARRGAPLEAAGSPVLGRGHATHPAATGAAPWTVWRRSVDWWNMDGRAIHHLCSEACSAVSLHDPQLAQGITGDELISVAIEAATSINAEPWADIIERGVFLQVRAWPIQRLLMVHESGDVSSAHMFIDRCRDTFERVRAETAPQDRAVTNPSRTASRTNEAADGFPITVEAARAVLSERLRWAAPLTNGTAESVDNWGSGEQPISFYAPIETVTTETERVGATVLPRGLQERCGVRVALMSTQWDSRFDLGAARYRTSVSEMGIGMLYGSQNYFDEAYLTCPEHAWHAIIGCPSLHARAIHYTAFLNSMEEAERFAAWISCIARGDPLTLNRIFFVAETQVTRNGTADAGLAVAPLGSLRLIASHEPPGEKGEENVAHTDGKDCD